MEFNYWQAISELIYAYTICHIDIIVAVITLSQFSQHPAEIHYQVVKHVFPYFNTTKTYGLIYWQPQPWEDLPLKANPTHITSKSWFAEYNIQTKAKQLHGSCDSTWGYNWLEWHSMGGVVMMLAGAAIYYCM